MVSLLGGWMAYNQLLLLLDEAGNILWASPLAEAQFRGQRTQVAGAKLLDLFVNDHRKALQHQIGRALRHDGVWHGLVRPLEPTATMPLLRATLLPFVSDEADPAAEDERYLCLLFPARPEELPPVEDLMPDLTERLRAAERLLAVVEADMHGIILGASAPFLRMTGYRIAEIAGRPLAELLPDWNSDAAEADGSNVHRAVLRDGSKAWLLVKLHAVQNADGLPARQHLYCFDLTAQKEQEEALQRLGAEMAEISQQLEDSQQEIEALNEELENSQIEFISHQAAITRSVCTVEMDLEGSIINANDNVLEILGYEIDELRDQPHSTLLFDEDADRAEYAEMWQGFGEGRPKIGTFRRRHKDGWEVWLVGSYNAILDAEGEVQHVVMYAFDITLQKKQERELREAIEEQAATEEELRMNMEEIQTINEELEGQRRNVEHLLTEVRDSLNYAGRIQTAMIPGRRQLNQILPANYRADVFFRPRDIVSGDFYWLGRWNRRVVLAAGDGTGHGVPGSFMSLIGMSVLQKLVERGITDPVVLLEELDTEIQRVLGQSSGSELQDSIEIAICTLDERNGVVKLASANRPVWRIHNGELEEFAPNRVPVGGSQHANKTFDLQVIDMKPGQSLYLLSDGLQDQFGGPKGRKLGRRGLQQLLVELSMEPFEQRVPALEEAFDQWRGLLDQLDDVLCIALEYRGN